MQAPDPVAVALNDFGYRFVSAAVPATSTENELVSPFSGQIALSMLLNATRNDSFYLVLRTLGLPGVPLQRINLANQAALTAGSSDRVVFRRANSVWTIGSPLNGSFTNILKTYFGAETFNLQGSSDEAVGQINSWTSAQTEGMIPRLLSRLSPEDRFILVNAIAFEGQWLKPFDAKETKSLPFHPLKGPSFPTPTMASTTGTFGYSSVGNTQYLALPYRDGGFKMIVALPAKGQSATAVLRGMTRAKLSAAIDAMTSARPDILLPKLDLKRSYDLRVPLTSMGMGRLFGQADLTGASPELKKGVISQAIQQTALKLDEVGTKAAAATTMGGSGGGIQKVETPEFHADRPFAFFLVIDRPSGHAERLLAFAGVVNKP